MGNGAAREVAAADVKRELDELGKVIRRAAGELMEKLDRHGVGDLDVTVTLNWINTLRRRREVMILELARLEQATGYRRQGTGATADAGR